NGYVISKRVLNRSSLSIRWRSDSSASLKGKDGLAGCPFANAVFQRFRRGQVDRRAENIAQAVLQTNHVEERELPGCIELRHQIDVVSAFPARNGAKQFEPHDPRGLQFLLVRSEHCNDVLPIHLALQ